MRPMPLAIGSSIILVLTGIFSVTPFAAPVDLFQSAPGIDRSECEADCRRAYGGYEWAAPPLSEGAFYGYASCYQRCERRFWKAFDKEAEKLWKQNPSP
jgi:hypothetical protein